MPYEHRIKKAKPRAVAALTDERVWNEKLEPSLGLGKNFFDAESELSRREQQEIFDQLSARGYDLSSPEDVPAFIRAQIEKNYI